MAEPRTTGAVNYQSMERFISNFARDKSNKLWEPLKCWIHQPNDWKWIYDPVSDMVAEYDRQHKNYVYHEIKAKRRRHWDIYPLLAFTESKLPKNAILLDRVQRKKSYAHARDLHMDGHYHQ